MIRDNLIRKPILTYDDVLPIPAGTSAEELVDVRTYSKSIVAQYLKFDMVEYTGDQIVVRDGLAQALGRVNDGLMQKGLCLKVVYGYRHPAVQERYFTARKAEVQSQHPDLDDANLDRLTHNFVAAPSIAGHPAGAAVDLTLIDITTQKELSMGTAIADYSDPLLIQTFDERVSDYIMKNRLILHDAMVAEGFAPFYGEWWHFSFGDREWAAFYGEAAMYGPITFSSLL